MRTKIPDQNRIHNRSKVNVNPYILFGSIGSICILISIIFFLVNTSILPELFLNLGVSIIAVVIVEFVWRRSGGDPITKAITALWRAIRQLEELESSGITSVKVQRRQLEQPKHISLLCRLLETATRIDMMRLTLGAEISKNNKVVKSIENAISSNLSKVRIITLDPNTEPPNPSLILLQRIREEELCSEARGANERIRGALRQTWSQLWDIKNKFRNDSERNKCLELRCTHKVTIYMSIVRVDERMWVSPYLSSSRGGDSPVYEINGSQTLLFELFQKEFDHMWKQSIPVDDKVWQDFIK